MAYYGVMPLMSRFAKKKSILIIINAAAIPHYY
jgi:hypothetical protein